MTAKEKQELYNQTILQSNLLSQKIDYFHDAGIDEFNHLCPKEKKIVLYLCSLVKKEDTAFRPVRMKISEWCRVINAPVTGGNEYRSFKDLLKQLASKKFWVPYRDTSIICSSWIEEPIMDEATHEATLQLNEHMARYFLHVTSPFTMFKYGYVVQLKLKYSIDLYIFFKSIQNMPSWSVGPEFFHRLLGPKYCKCSDLERRVLIPVIREINQKTDIQVQYHIIRQGKALQQVVFSVALLEHSCIPA